MIIKLAGVHKSYPSRVGAGQKIEVLRGVDLTVEQGEMLIVMGSSGCGKTTLLNIIGGVLSASEGSVNVDGIDLVNASEKDKARLRNEKIGFIFQAFNLLPNYTAIDNVALPMKFRNGPLPGGLPRDIAMSALGKVGLTDKADSYPPELSGGQNQRIAIARALVMNPDIILADEPTGNLDTSTANDILSFLKSLASEEGLTIVLVTHEDWVAQMGSRTLNLREGRVVQQESGEA